jgi:hypothetical protein
MKTTNARPRRAPSLTIDITGLPVAALLRAHVARRLRRAVVGVRTSPIVAHVTFADVNGPKGGLDVRCAVDMRIPRAAPLHAEEFAARDVLAFDRAADVITRRIAERVQRRQESARRPKKYFAAKRLL